MYINPKNECVAIALLREEDDHNPEDKRRNNAQRVDQLQNLKRHILLVCL